MSEISVTALQRYFTRMLKGDVTIIGIGGLGTRPEDALKEYGYGTPLRIDFTIEGEKRSVVFNTVKPGGFGHERMADRAAILLWEYRAFNALPRHVRALDVGALTRDRKGRTSAAVKNSTYLAATSGDADWRRQSDNQRRVSAEPLGKLMSAMVLRARLQFSRISSERA